MQDRPFTCFPVFGPPTVTFTAGPDRNGYTLDGWTGCDATAGRDCSASIDGDRSVTARFRDVQAPGFGAHSGTVGADEGQTATNSGTFSDNASGDVLITASRGA